MTSQGTDSDLSEEIDDLMYLYREAKNITVRADARKRMLRLVQQERRKAAIEELDELPYVDWEQYSPDGSGINELFDPCVDEYVLARKAEIQGNDVAASDAIDESDVSNPQGGATLSQEPHHK